MSTSIRETVALNLARLRKRRGLSLRRLAVEIEERTGCDLTADALHRIENQKRQVTVEELVALALALEVSPVALLLPADRQLVRLAPEVAAQWAHAWRWACGEVPLGADWPRDPSIRDWIAANRPHEADRPVPVELSDQLRARTGVPVTARFYYRPEDDRVVGEVAVHAPQFYEPPEEGRSLRRGIIRSM